MNTERTKEIKNELVKTEDMFLQKMVDEKLQVSIFLISGIRLVGRITQYDNHTIKLQGNGDQIIYKHAVSTVLNSSPNEGSSSPRST